MQETGLLIVDLEQVFGGVVASLETSIRETGAIVTHDSLPSLAAHPGNMDRVLQNLVANALKYSKPGVPPRIHLSATRNRDEWEFTLEDNGCGFDQLYAERIFGIFRRLHGTEKAGTGIGLAICKAIIERSGGRIWAEGEPGIGARFHFSIPDSRPS